MLILPSNITLELLWFCALPNVHSNEILVQQEAEAPEGWIRYKALGWSKLFMWGSSTSVQCEIMIWKELLHNVTVIIPNFGQAMCPLLVVCCRDWTSSWLQVISNLYYPGFGALIFQLPSSQHHEWTSVPDLREHLVWQAPLRWGGEALLRGRQWTSRAAATG